MKVSTSPGIPFRRRNDIHFSKIGRVLQALQAKKFSSSTQLFRWILNMKSSFTAANTLLGSWPAKRSSNVPTSTINIRLPSPVQIHVSLPLLKRERYAQNLRPGVIQLSAKGGYTLVFLYAGLLIPSSLYAGVLIRCGSYMLSVLVFIMHACSARQKNNRPYNGGCAP
jgi:hypothetical protein